MDFNIDNYISNLQYINKDFNSLWEEILETVPKLTNKWDPNESNESDPLVVLLKELGIISDKVNYNTDKNILESFPDLLTQLRTAYSVFNSLGYNPNWYRSATTTINIIYNGGTENKSYIEVNESDLKGKEIIFPKFTSLCDDEKNIVYTTLEDVTFKLGEITQKSVRAIEGTLNNYEINGSTLITADNLDNENKLYFTQNNIAQNGIYISNTEDFKNFDIDEYNRIELKDRISTPTIAKDTLWKRVDNLYQYLPVSYVFKFGIDPSNGSNYIQFPEDVGTLINDGIYIKYILSNGEAGNIKKSALSTFLDTNFSISAGSITTTDEDGNSSSVEENVVIKNFTINNALASQNGKDPETISEMRNNYQKIVGTFNTLVTLRDYENYIYTYENNLGENLVSNIRVSDRTNDLYDYIPYVSLEESGDENTKEIPAPEGKDGLTVYDLRLYPLSAKSVISSKSDYDKTFEYGQKEIQNRIINATDDVKCISHSYKADIGQPIIVNYDIIGQIYLQKTVSKSEAQEIKSNIDLAIYQNFNARKLSFGEAIDYSTLVSVVKNADPRIQYVAINPISYEVDENSLSQTRDEKFVSSGYDVTKRSILKGLTPWTQFDTFKYQWGQTNNKKAPTKITIEEKDRKQNFIKSYVKVLDKNAQSYKVKKNESFNFILPEYVSKTAYSNYFYLVNNIELKANVPHTLEGNEKIEIYEERPWKTEAGEYIKDPKAKLAATLKAGTIVRSNLDIETHEITNALNMGSKYILEVVDKNISEIKNTAIIGKAVETPRIKIATNSIGLLKYLRALANGEVNTYKSLKNGSAINAGYLLNMGEYLMWANDTDPVLEVGLIGEGNTIIASGGISFPSDNPTAGLIITGNEDIDKIDFITVNSNILTCQTNVLYSLGEGNTIKATKNGNDVTLFSNIGNNPEYPFYIDADTIIYQNENEAEGTITGVAKDDLIHGLLTLKILSSPDTSQTLLKDATTEQIIEILNLDVNDLTPKTITSIPYEGNNSFYTNAVLEYAGGAGLYLTDKEADILEFLTYINTSNIDFSTYFKTLNQEKITALVPGVENELFIFPAIFRNDNSQNIIRNVIIKNKGQSLKLNSIYIDKEGNIQKASERTAEIYGLDQIGPIYKVVNEAVYYQDENNPTVKVNTIELSSEGYRILQPSEIYVIDFNVVTQPSDEELIKDPTDASTFFRKEHPYNRYVIPKLKDSDDLGNALTNLTISSLSIKE